MKALIKVEDAQEVCQNRSKLSNVFLHTYGKSAYDSMVCRFTIQPNTYRSFVFQIVKNV